MDKMEEVLQLAHSYFTAKDYRTALFLYGQVLYKDPTNPEYKMYCIFCDVGFENDEKAQSLFEYFVVSKEEDFESSLQYIQEVLEEYDDDNENMLRVLNELTADNVETLNAIEYSDFMQLVQVRGSFKEAYQDIMFSTKVAITSKEDLIDFINKLIENNFDTTAYKYLDGFNEFFVYDDILLELYEKLGKKKSAT